MKKYKMKINGLDYEARIVEFSETTAKITVNGIDFEVEFDNEDKVKSPQIIQVERTTPPPPPPSEVKTTTSDGNEVRAPIPGVVLGIKVKEGETVKNGDVLLILEAMKMESEIVSTCDGIVEKIFINERTPVQEGDLLLKIAGT
ncbi:MAG: biotin/lipoyl-binding protein [Candidatus Cloacimonetes bacterium]|nr:biotin/lipoyl-binding protein [Candidatus Cloacimonadota bacterium]